MGIKSFWPLWIYWIEPVFVYVSFNTETVKIVVKTQIHMHCSVINQKIKIFCDFRVFVINPIPKNENSEITEIHQKPKILKCEYVTSKTLDMLSKRHQYQNDSATLLIIFEKDFPWFLGFHFENPEKGSLEITSSTKRP